MKVSSLGAYILLGDKETMRIYVENPYNFILEASFTIRSVELI